MLYINDNRSKMFDHGTIHVHVTIKKCQQQSKLGILNNFDENGRIIKISEIFPEDPAFSTEGRPIIRCTVKILIKA